MYPKHSLLRVPRRIQSLLFTVGASRSESLPPGSSIRPPTRLAAWRATLLLLGLGFLADPAAGQDYWVLHSFTGTDGTQLGAGLILSGDTFYGTTELGGCWGQGTLFRMNTDGSGYIVLRHFDDISQGSNPLSDLALSGTALFGTTEYGGDTNRGTVFTLNTDGTGFNVLRAHNQVAIYHFMDVVVLGQGLQLCFRPNLPLNAASGCHSPKLETEQRFREPAAHPHAAVPWEDAKLRLMGPFKR
jgi:uncharacterized repeat protein (TIGR03803 family)